MKTRLRNTAVYAQRAFASQGNTMFALLVIVTLVWVILNKLSQ